MPRQHVIAHLAGALLGKTVLSIRSNSISFIANLMIPSPFVDLSSLASLAQSWKGNMLGSKFSRREKDPPVLFLQLFKA